MKRFILFLTCYSFVLNMTTRAQIVPLVHYDFNDPASTEAIDISGNGYDGTLSIPEDTFWVAGVDGGYALEVKDTQCVTIPYLGMVSNIGSVALWMKSDEDNTGVEAMFWAGDDLTGSLGNGFGSQHEMHLQIEGGPNSAWVGGECSFWANGENGGDPLIQDGDSTVHLFSDPEKGDYAGNPPVNPILINDGQWHHVAATWGNDSAKLFIDGGLIMGKLYWPGTGFDLTHMYLGMMGYKNRRYIGIMDEVSIYDYVLTNQDVRDLYAEIELCITITDTIWVYDTITTEVIDTTVITVHKNISVTDSLVLNVTITGINPPNIKNTIRIYPNPTHDIVFINTGANYSQMGNYKIRILSASGQEIFNSVIEKQNYEVDLSKYGDKGLYFISILNGNNTIIETRKLILE
ncbi:MAG: T9SS type A sorting domain-containing protein [Bacteroidales bacterium]|nr:T9SS type A sorting domain-containing protein [Bacteroidales bacterium]